MREIRTRGRSRGYRAITGIMLLLAVAVPIMIGFAPSPSDDLSDITIGIGPGTIDGLDEQLAELAEGIYDLTTVELGDDSAQEIDEHLSNGRLDVAVRAPSTLVWDETQDTTVSNLISAALQRAQALQRADELNLDITELEQVLSPMTVEQNFVNVTSNTEGVRSGLALFGLFLAFLLPQMFGQFTMMSVVEEKSTRVVEVLLSQIRPGTLLAGKILGLCSLAVVQLALIVAGLVASLLVTNVVDVPASVWQFVPMMTISILGGLAIYTTLFALLGSLISRQEDQAQVVFPVFVPLMGGYLVGQTAVFGNAESLLVKILTWFPLTAPMLLPVRVARGAIGPGEIVVSLGLLALSVYLLFKLAGRVYEFTLLRTGTRVGWGELIRLSRGSVDD
jgi:ABC-2 type transport system permease protein